LLDSFGAIILLVATVLYPSELSETEKFYKSIMLPYSLRMQASQSSYAWVEDFTVNATMLAL